MKSKTYRITVLGMLIALSFVGSYIKIPSPLQSIALDSMPAFLAGLILGGPAGGLVAFVGHLLTAANAGFPLSLPIHLLVAFIMVITVLLFQLTYKKVNLVAAGIVGIVVNGVGAPLVMAFLPQFGWGFFIGITPFLLLASAINVIAAIMVFISLKKTQLFKGLQNDEK